MNKLEKQTIRLTPEEYELGAQLCKCALDFEAMWKEKNIEFAAEVEDKQ